MEEEEDNIIWIILPRIQFSKNVVRPFPNNGILNIIIVLIVVIGNVIPYFHWIHQYCCYWLTFYSFIHYHKEEEGGRGVTKEMITLSKLCETNGCNYCTWLICIVNTLFSYLYFWRLVLVVDFFSQFSCVKMWMSNYIIC